MIPQHERFGDGITAERQPLSVSELTQYIRGSLQANFSSVWVAGEITDLARPRSGHVYFTLKDEQAQLAAVIWRSTAERLKVPLADGLRVVCWGGIDVYPARGNYQLIVKQVEPLGEGALQRALRQLQARLAAEGLFDPSHKQPLPAFPRRIAVITSPTGAALHDFLEVTRRRWAGPEVWVIPAAVQGVAAKEELVAGVQLANRLQPPPDVIVLTRGGGSIEDLWSFNEEAVVRAIFASRIPVVSAVGHEIDVTLSDLVADRRALTPSEAAELLIPSAEELHGRLDATRARLRTVTFNRLREYRARLDSLARRPVIARPWERLRELSRRLDELDARLGRGIRRAQEWCRERLEQTAARLEALSPLAVLKRGYSVTTRIDSGRVLTELSQAHVGLMLRTRVLDGEIDSMITALAPKKLGVTKPE